VCSVMENEQDNPRSSRSVVISAVALAVVVAGGIWYFLVVRQPDLSEVPATAEVTITDNDIVSITTPDTKPSNTNQQQATATESDQPKTNDSTQPDSEQSPTSAIAGADDTPAPNVATTAATGSTPITLALVLVAVLSGIAGLRRFT
jgi:cytoskeletal protein RodZ